MSDADDLIKKLNRYVVDVEKAVDDTVRIIAHRVQVSAIKAIREPTIGTIYVRPSGIIHVASKPGDAPNTDTGRLVGSIAVEHTRGSMLAKVGTNLVYGAVLETVMNRPWLEVSLNLHIGNYKKQLEKVVDRQLKKAGK